MSAPLDPRGDGPAPAGNAGEVFEANLRALLQRAYVPALPSAEFRQRAEAALLEALPAASHRPQGTRWPTLLPALATAAALLLALTVWWWLDRPLSGTATPGPWLRRGLVAVRATPDTDWHGLEPARNTARAHLDGSFLELVTPERASLEVLVPASDRVLARPASHARLTLHAPPASDPVAGAEIALAVAWDAGGLLLANSRAAAAWRLDTPGGTIVLAGGTLDVAQAEATGGILTVELLDGSAWLLGRRGRVDLPSGALMLLVGGELVPPRPSAAVAPAASPPGRAFPEVRATQPPEPIVVSPDTEPAPAPPAPLELVGRVSDAATGAPVTSFQVSIVRDRMVAGPNEPRTRVFQDEGGRFRWSGIEADKWALFVTVDECAVASREGLVVSAETALAPLEIAIERGTPLRGFVVDAANGWPIEGAVVLSEADVPMRNLPLDAGELPPEVTVVTRSAKDGSFELPRLSSGEHVLRVTAGGFAPLWTERLTVRAGEPVEDLLLRLKPGAAVDGRVAANAAGDPWPQAIMLAWHSDPIATSALSSFSVGVTDAQGRYQIADLPPGDAQVLLLGDESSMQSGQPPSLQPVRLVAGKTVTLNFPGEGAVRLHGRVLDAQEQPVAGLGVSVMRQDVPPELAQSSWRGTMSAPDGSYEISGLTAGLHEVYAGNPTENMCAYGHVNVPLLGDAPYDVKLAAGRIVGRVSALADGAAVPAAFAILEVETLDAVRGRTLRFAAYAKSGADGRYAFERVSDGVYRLTAYDTRGGLGQEHSAIRVQDGLATGGTDLQLVPGGGVHVTVRTASGEPVTAARVTFRDVDGTEVSFDQHPLTDAAGRYTARGVKPGRWYVLADKTGMRRAELAVEVQAGVEQPANLTLEPVP